MKFAYYPFFCLVAGFLTACANQPASQVAAMTPVAKLTQAQPVQAQSAQTQAPSAQERAPYFTPPGFTAYRLGSNWGGSQAYRDSFFDDFTPRR